MSTNSRHFTKHGFYIKNSGKEWFAKLTATQIEMQFKFSDKSELIIPLNWKEETKTSNITPDNNHENMLSIEIDPMEIPIPSTQTQNNRNNMVNTKSIHRISSRNKKVPITMTKDFLWLLQMPPDLRKYLPPI
jgi:hypothetical protein